MSKVNKGAALYTCNVSWTKIKFRKVENGIGVRQLDERQRAQPDMQWGSGDWGRLASGCLGRSLLPSQTRWDVSALTPQLTGMETTATALPFLSWRCG